MNQADQMSMNPRTDSDNSSLQGYGFIAGSASEHGRKYGNGARPGNNNGINNGNGIKPSERLLNLREYWHAILLRKWYVLAVTLMFALVSAYMVEQMRVVYRSSALVLVDSARPKNMSVDEVTNTQVQSREYFATQVETMTSRSVADRVIKQLQLEEVAEFDPNRASAFRAWADAKFGRLLFFWPKPAALQGEALDEARVVLFGSRLTAVPVRTSQLIRVSFDSEDPKLAAKVANAVVDAFIQADIDSRATIALRSGAAVNERMAELKAQLDRSETALQTYREQQGLLDAKVTAFGGEGRQLDGLTQKLVEARVRLLEASEAYNQVKGQSDQAVESAPAVLRNPGVQRAKDVEADAEKRYAEITQRYGSTHPSHMAAVSDLNAAKAVLKRQVQTVVASINKEYEAARATDAAIRDQINRSRGSIQDTNRKDIQAAMLEREADSNKQIFQAFLARFKETQATGDLQTASARLSDPAVPELTPVKPFSKAIIALSALAGCLLAIAGAVTARYMNDRVVTGDDVERRLGQQLLAALPQMDPKANRIAAREMLEQPDSAYSEAVKTSATGIMLSTMELPHRVIAVTSSLPGEGKSTYAINLAQWLARSRKVLFIEGDMRRPSLIKALSSEYQNKGLSELISQTAPFKDCVVIDPTSGLHMMLCNDVPKNSLELLLTERFKRLIWSLNKIYDFVIIDTPPVQLVSDALVIGKVAHGMVFVAKADSTPVAMANTGLKQITDAGIPLLGIVLNRINYKKAYYYGDYSRFGSGREGAKYGHGKYGSYGSYASTGPEKI